MQREPVSPARGFLLALAVMLGCGMMSPAVAGPVTFTYSGTVDFVHPDLAGTVSLGDALAGSYTFESTTGAAGGSTSTFAIFDALTSLSFTLGSYSAPSTGAPEIQVDNDPGGAFHDR